MPQCTNARRSRTQPEWFVTCVGGGRGEKASAIWGVLRDGVGLSGLLDGGLFRKNPPKAEPVLLLEDFELGVGLAVRGLVVVKEPL